MGPLLQAGRYGHIRVRQELNVQGLFSILGTGRLISYLCMGCVTGGEATISVRHLFAVPPLHAAARQSASASQFSRPCDFPCWPSQILSLIILKSKTDGPFLWIPQCIAVFPLPN